jgi:hypothetical protein
MGVLSHPLDADGPRRLHRQTLEKAPMTGDDELWYEDEGGGWPKPKVQADLSQFEQFHGDHMNLIKAMTQVCTIEQIAKITNMVIEARGPGNQTDPAKVLLKNRKKIASLVAPSGWFLERASHQHTGIHYRGDKHEPLPYAAGPWVVEFQRYPDGGSLKSARGHTLEEAWANAAALCGESK